MIHVKAASFHPRYENADQKAQIVLTLDGVFLSFVASQAFTKAADLHDIQVYFGPETTLLLDLMALSLAASILSAITCLHPRLQAEHGKTESMLKDEIGKRDNQHKTTGSDSAPNDGFGRFRTSMALTAYV